MNLKIWFISIACLVATRSTSQDIHFSQFDVFQPQVNPAFVGFMPDAFRFSLINRTQWKAVSKPFRTFGLNAEASDLFNAKGLGLGLVFITDIAGDSRYTNNNFSLSAGYHVKIPKTKHHVGIGAQVTYIQQRIDYSQLSYDNQYNGLFYDPNLSSKEFLNMEKQTFSDFSIGGAYQYRKNKEEFISVGLAWYNLSAVQVSLLSDPSVQLDSRTTFTSTADRKINSKYAILPSAIVSLQGAFREIVIGGRVRRVIKDIRGDYKAVYGGVYWRNKDAIYLVIGMDYNDWYGGISYDVNLSSLREASNARGGFELVITYKMSKFSAYLKSHKSCPTFF